jgi:hypothetical protein
MKTVAILASLIVATPAAGGYFDIEEGPAEETLSEWSKQAQIPIGYGYRSIEGIHTRAVHGWLDPFIALRWMIEGTPLYFDILKSGTVSAMRGEIRCSPEEETPALPPCKRWRSPNAKGK